MKPAWLRGPLVLLAATATAALMANPAPATETARHARAEREHAFTVALPLAEAFVLFEPVGEKNWAEDWRPVFASPEDAALHDGSVFTVTHAHPIHGRIESVWMVIEYLLPESTDGGKLTREEALFGNVKTVLANKQLTRGSVWECVDVPDAAYGDGRVAIEAARRLAEFKRTGERFFFAVGFARPHLPFVAPKKYWDLYERAKMPLARNPAPPKESPAYALKGLMELNQFSQIPETPPLSDELQRTLIHGYYAGVSYSDAQIGRVLDALEREGLADNTIVVIWGDNGFSFGTHGDWTKHSNYEEANHIPVIFAGPGIARGAATNALLETVDLYPTLAELADLGKPAGPQPMDGRSQVPVLKDPLHARVKDYVYHAYPRSRPRFGGEWLGRAIRTSRYRFVDWRPLGPSDAKPDFELFDYDTDPLESENIAMQHPELIDQFEKILAEQPMPKRPLE